MPKGLSFRTPRLSSIHAETERCVNKRYVIDENTGLDFSASIPDGPVWVHADAEALRRALRILIDNAAKYTPEGGSVRIKLSANDGFASFTVTDTGIGIAPADLPHIFDRFWRADKARSRSQGGASLGLSIAKWIAETHGGSITVESESGEGSVFCLNVPVEKQS